MFCWGGGRGGRRWQEFLSLPGSEDSGYLELQAGLAPTQLHTADIAAGTAVDWVQGFTAFDTDPAAARQQNWTAAAEAVRSRLEEALPAAALTAALEAGRRQSGLECGEIISMGSGWAALEERAARSIRASRSIRAAQIDHGGGCSGGSAFRIPPGLSFPAESCGEAEGPWAALLESGALPARNPGEEPGAFVSGPLWEALLERSAGNGDWLAPYHLGVMAFERGDGTAAAAHWEASLRRAENPWALRNLARLVLENPGGLRADEGRKIPESETAKGLEKALDYYRRAMDLKPEDPSFLDEYVPLLLEAGKTAEAAGELAARFGSVMEMEPEKLSFPLLNAAAAIALEQGDDALLDRIFSVENAHIREGNNTLTNIWREREIRRRVAAGLSRTEAEARVRNALTEGTLAPPREIDFRMY